MRVSITFKRGVKNPYLLQRNCSITTMEFCSYLPSQDIGSLLFQPLWIVEVKNDEDFAVVARVFGSDRMKVE